MEAAAVLRFCVALFAILLAVPLAGAGSAPSLLGTPTLVVYPFAVNGSAVSKEAGSRLAVTIATQIANLGGVIVKPAAPGAERQNYLEDAHHEGADYYIAGYVTPLGDGVSVVEQLVSTQTGIVVFSNTGQVRTFEDITGQGDLLREALLRHQTRNLGAYAAPPPPATTPTPAPGTGAGTQANLGRLFGRKQRRSTEASPKPSPSATAVARSNAPRPAATALPSAGPAPPTPAPAALAAAPPPRAGFGVLGIGGSAQTDRRNFAGAAIANVMLANHQRATTAGGTDAAACNSAGVGTLVGGNLATRNHTILGERQTLATLEFLAYDCTGGVVYRKTFAHDARGDWKAAVDGVVQRAVAEFLHASPAARHG